MVPESKQRESRGEKQPRVKNVTRLVLCQEMVEGEESETWGGGRFFSGLRWRTVCEMYVVPYFPPPSRARRCGREDAEVCVCKVNRAVVVWGPGI
jgi:hypothetical protein